MLVRAALINSLYRRGLGLTPRARTQHPKGALVNHLSTDISRVDYAAQWFHPSWTSPIQVSRLEIRSIVRFVKLTERPL